jgi:ATP-dependent protease Clp ATPase subunit
MSPLVLGRQDHCVFCGKRAREVFGFAVAADARVRICDECVALCLDLFAKERSSGRASRTFPSSEPCSFCGRSEAEAGKIIAGPTVYICEGCAGEARTLLAGSPNLAVVPE